MSDPIQPPAVRCQPPPSYQQSSQQQLNPYASYPPPQQVPIFQVTTMSHVGALIFWFNQRRTVRGTHEQCAAALRSAQTQNLIVGWWSLFSVLILNWVALIHNSNALEKLNHDARQAQAYAQWWHTYVGPSRT